MAPANAFINIWGPALLVCFTLIVGLFYQNARMNDMKESFNKRFDDLTKTMDKRIDDLKDYIGSEFKRVDQRIDRLEVPVGRK